MKSDRENIYDLIISNGRIVDDGVFDHAPLEIGIHGGRIKKIAPVIVGDCEQRLDAAGKLILPGLIDPHVHLGLPMKGTLSSDTPETGTRAALLGGVTTVLDFTLQCPGQTLPESLRVRRDEFTGHSYTDYGFHVCVTHFPDDWAQTIGDQLTRIREAGAASLKVFPCYSREELAIQPDQLRKLLRVSTQKELLVLVHAEDDRLLIENERHLFEAGTTEPNHYPLSRPAAAEEIAIEQVIEAAIAERAPIYFVHVSTAGGVNTIVSGRLRSPRPVYLETCPHYFTLDESVYLGPEAAQYMVAPPIRSLRHKTRILKALAKGEVDIVATDHCPFRVSQKIKSGQPFTEIPNGLPGVETRLALVNTLAVSAGLITMQDLVRVCSANPARIHQLYPAKGSIEPGTDADLILFNPNIEWSLDAETLHMNTDFSPYNGLAVKGSVDTVLLRGNVVVRDKKIVGEPTGRYLNR